MLPDRRESREIEFVRTYDTQERERVRRASEGQSGGGKNRKKENGGERETRRREPGEGRREEKVYTSAERSPEHDPRCFENGDRRQRDDGAASDTRRKINGAPRR